MPTVQCPSCGVQLKVSEAALGRNGRCPTCQTKFLVELPAAEAHDRSPPNPPRSARHSPASERQVQPPAVVPQPGSTPAKMRRAKLPKKRPARPAWLLPAVVGGSVAGLLLLVAVI